MTTGWFCTTLSFTKALEILSYDGNAELLMAGQWECCACFFLFLPIGWFQGDVQWVEMMVLLGCWGLGA